MFTKNQSSKIANVKTLFGLLLLLTAMFTVFACNQKKLAKSPDLITEEAKETVFMEVEQMPVFPGGELALRKFIASSVKYPVEAFQKKMQGKVFVSFVVAKDGSVTNVNNQLISAHFAV